MADDIQWLAEGYWARIRGMREEDAETVVDWRNRPHNARWVQRASLTVSQHLTWFAGARERREALLMFVSPGGQPFGTCAFYGFDPARTSAEYGRLCSAEPGAQALGMVEGIYLAHRLAFDALRIARLHCACAATNENARRLNRFFGYREEGLRRKHLWMPDGSLDVVEFGMFPEEFTEARVEVERMLYRKRSAPSVDTAAAAAAIERRHS